MKEKADEIIVNLVKSTDFTNCMKKVWPDIREDIQSEVTLILLETKPEVILSLSEKNQLKFYAARIILLSAFSKTSPFYKKYRRHEELKGFEAADESMSIINRKMTEERVISEIEKLDWYESEMLKLYGEVGSFRKMQECTMIPYGSCFVAVKAGIKKVQEKVLSKHTL